MSVGPQVVTLGGHDLGDAQLQEPGPAEVQPPHDVALGDDADQALALEHGERADVVLGEGRRTRSATDVAGSTVATDEPLPRSTSAIRMIWPPLSSPLTEARVRSATSVAKGPELLSRHRIR